MCDLQCVYMYAQHMSNRGRIAEDRCKLTGYYRAEENVKLQNLPHKVNTNDHLHLSIPIFVRQHHFIKSAPGLSFVHQSC